MKGRTTSTKLLLNPESTLLSTTITPRLEIFTSTQQLHSIKLLKKTCYLWITRSCYSTSKSLTPFFTTPESTITVPWTAYRCYNTTSSVVSTNNDGNVTTSQLCQCCRNPPHLDTPLKNNCSLDRISTQHSSTTKTIIPGTNGIYITVPVIVVEKPKYTECWNHLQ